MVHRGQDTRLLSVVLKTDKDYIGAFRALVTATEASLAALQAYASSCPPTQSTALLGVIGALKGIDSSWGEVTNSIERWREELKTVKKKEDEVGAVLRDREIL